MGENFLLDTGTARALYHGCAKELPILDYHCHLDPRELWEDRRFENLTQLWLLHDHYKWRVMRSNGVKEQLITGDADDREKFQAFAETLPRAIGNPMYHWCHLELKNYFGYEGVLNGDTAQQVWDWCRERLTQDPQLSARGILQKSRVYMVGTTDDPCSKLEWHEKLSTVPDFSTRVCPTFRPDPLLNIGQEGFNSYLERLEQCTGCCISTIEDLRGAISVRIDYFARHGCCSADHGLYAVIYQPVSDEEVTRTMQMARVGKPVSREAAEGYQTALLLHCAREYAKRGWVMQLHFGCIRNPNRRMLRLLGSDAGYDGMGVTDSSQAAYQFLDRLDSEGRLPKTVLYSLNPADNAWIDVLLGAFQGPETPGKLQHGCAWWFNDHHAGIIEHLTSLANLSLLGNFIGMLTDSRSLISYARHEYFRRILCALLGRWVERGEYPDDRQALDGIVQDICFRNAVRYFNLQQ